MAKFRRIEIMFEGGTDVEADALFDAVADAAHEHEPEGVDVHVASCMDDVRPWWLR